jgi:hypothetical protein
LREAEAAQMMEATVAVTSAQEEQSTAQVAPQSMAQAEQQSMVQVAARSTALALEVPQHCLLATQRRCEQARGRPTVVVDRRRRRHVAGQQARRRRWSGVATRYCCQLEVHLSPCRYPRPHQHRHQQYHSGPSTVDWAEQWRDCGTAAPATRHVRGLLIQKETVARGGREVVGRRVEAQGPCHEARARAAEAGSRFCQ